MESTKFKKVNVVAGWGDFGTILLYWANFSFVNWRGMGFLG